MFWGKEIYIYVKINLKIINENRFLVGWLIDLFDE